MKRTFTFLMTALFLCVGMTVKAQHWLQPTVSTDKETYEYYIANYRNGDYFVTSTKGLSGGAQQLGSANAFDDTKAKVTFKLVEGGKLWSTNTTTPLIVGYTTTDGAANSVQLFAEDSQEGYTWKIEYANGGNTLSAGSSDNSWNMHGGAGANIGLYGKTDGGSNWVFIPANDAAVAKAAEAIAEYAPSTEFYYQIKNVKHSRMLAANATNATSISTNSTADLNQLWAFEKDEDGAFYLRNAGQEKYLVAASSNNTAWTVGAEGSAFEVELLDIKKVNYALHAVGQDEYGNAHDANWGTDAQVVRWLASAEASQWYLEKTEISTKAVGISLVYSLTYNGEEKFTQTCTGFVGEAYPEVNVALPFGIVATKPAGELTADVAGKVVEAKLSDNLPFTYAADVKSVESWYYLLFHATGKNYLYYAADDAVLEANKTSVDTNDKDAYAWAFVGNPFDGFKVYNKKAGKFLDAAKDGAVVAAADEQVFTLTASSHASNGFFMQAKDGEYKERFNKQSDKVVYWSGADAGSTFMVRSEITYQLTDALGNTYTGVYMGVAGETVPTLSGVAGYTLSNEAWNGTTYTANIAFPFPVSNAEITNPLMIGSHNSEAFLWRAEGTGITVLKDATADSDNYKWAIYPAFSEGNFTFTIKNLGTGKYINSTSAENSHAEGAVTLADEGTAFTVEANNKFKLATGKFLSVNSSKDDKVQIVGTWGEHGGVYNKFVAVAVEVASVTLDQTEATLTEAGATVTLVATVAPENAADKTVTWSTSDDKVATVVDGVVTAVANGKATITAKAGEKTATCEVTVAIPEVDPNDYTSYIKNAAVTSAEGWNIGAGKHEGGLMKYGSGKLVDFNQTITLPAGQYKMTAKAAYRYTGGEQSEYEAIQAGTNTHLAKLYAETATYKYEGNVMNRYEGASDTDYAAGSGSVTVNGKFVPNSSSAVLKWFEAGQYVNEIVFNVQADGEVKIGIETKETVPGGEYTNISAWTLTRLGDAEADPKEEEPTPDTPVDVTDKVGTSKEAWNAGGVSGAWDNGIGGMPEKYETTTATTGDVMWQTVTGLANGKYVVELWANARYTSGRGFDSPAKNGQHDCTYLFANNVEISIPVVHNADCNSNTSHVLEGVVVTDGTLKMGMTKKAAGSNWHTIQIKSLTYLGETSAEDLLNLAKEQFTAAYNEFNVAFSACQAMNLKMSFFEIVDAADQLYRQLDAATDAELLKTKTEELNNATASLNEINEVYAEYNAFVQKFKTASEISSPKNQDARDLLEFHMYGGGGMQASSLDALKQAIQVIKEDYVAYVANADLLEGNKFDLTFLINDAAVTSTDAWETNAGIASNVDYEGAPDIYALDKWDGGQLEVYAKQTLKNLPAGVYTLTAMGRRNNDEVIMSLYASADGQEYKSNIPAGEAWHALKLEEIIVSGGEMVVGFVGTTNNSWVAFDNFQLYYAGAAEVEPEYLTVVGAKVGDVAIVEGKATVESISSFEITFDRPVALAEDAEWAQLTDKWGDNPLKAEVLEDNNSVVRFSLQWGQEFTEAGDFYLYIPEGVVVDAENVNCINAAIEAVITVEGGSVEPATPLAVVNVTVGEDVMSDLSAIVATTEDMIKVNFDGKFYFQGEPSIVDAEGNDASSSFEYMNGLDVDGSNSYIFMGKKEGTYTITLAKAQFNELEMMGWKAPAEDIVLTVTISVPDGIQNINADADAVIYDIHGRRVEKMTKGLYIVNGRKVMVK